MSELGIHKARAIAGSEQFSPDKSGNLLIGIDMQLDDGEVMTTTLSFSGKAAEHSMRKLRKLGWSHADDVTDLMGIDSNEVEVRVFEEDYTNPTTGVSSVQQKCEITKSGGFRFEKQLDDRGKKTFAAQYRGLAKSIPVQTANGAQRSTSSYGGARKATGTNGGPPDRDFAADHDANDDIGF